MPNRDIWVYSRSVTRQIGRYNEQSYVVPQAKQLLELEPLLSTFSGSFRKLYEKTPPFNGGKWLVMDVKKPEQLEEVRRLILMKAKPAKKEA